jgi:hypothetical protein
VSPSYPNNTQLVQMALDHVRSVFKGNGIKTDKISVVSHSISNHILHAGTYLELRPVVNERVVPGQVGGNVVAGREEATSRIDQTMINSTRDAATKTQMTGALLNRPDKGFGLNGHVIPLDFIHQDFIWYDKCGSCQGSGHGICQKCSGRRSETCVKCNGRTMMVCPTCHSTGMVKGLKCKHCIGKRYVPCALCRQSGVMACRGCKGTGHSQCLACQGRGNRTHMLSLSAQALTYFEYDPKTIPKVAADIIETHAGKLVQTNSIKIDGRVADDKENALGASYEVNFPAGDIIFMIGGKEFKCGIFGYRAELHDFPLVLDKLLQRPIEDLEEAANNMGSVADKIRNTSKFRIIAQAFLLTAKTSAEKAAAYLEKKYDIGLSHGTALKIATLAEQATMHITRKPRYYGFAAGIAVSALLMGLYYNLGLRSLIVGHLPDPRFDIILDVMPLLLSGILATMCIKISAGQAMRKALGHLFPPQQKKNISFKAGALGPLEYAFALPIMIFMIEIAHTQGTPLPYWYNLIRGLIRF